jgi:hypothetical protein
MLIRFDLLTLLSGHLRNVVAVKYPERFRMAQWCCGKDFKSNYCGTSGCAIGHACEIPEIRALGLQLVCQGNIFPPHPMMPSGLTDFDAIAELFCITREQAIALFANKWLLEKESALDVAKRIEQFCIDNGGVGICSGVVSG